ncbi:MAG: hypothetical protein SV186_06355 [Candidatus Nanohaloarchaea archaeon]|nr:hypothetical protein [Candidatus Nanohaloarchaea archaeon]
MRWAVVLLGLYGLSALFGTLFLFYLFRVLAETRMIGSQPRSWIMLSTGLAMIATSSILELVFVSNPRALIFNTFNLYFTVGNILVFRVLLTIWRNLEGYDGF